MSDINAIQNQGSTQLAASDVQQGLTATTSDPSAPTAALQPQAGGDAATGLANATGTPVSSDPTNQQSEASTDSPELALLREIKSDIGALSTKIDDAQKIAARNGAIAGGVAGGIAGGIVATGVSFIRAKLGL